MMFRSATLAVCSILFAQGASANDISGVRIGSSLDEARIAIKMANRSFVLSPFIDDGEMIGVTAIAAPRAKRADDGSADEFVALQDNRGTVWFVGRYQRLAPGSRFSMDDLLASLNKKFGTPSNTPRTRYYDYSWEYDRQGKLYDGFANAGPCAGLVFSRPHLPGMSISAPEEFPSKCGMQVRLTNFLEENGLVSYFTLTVVDAKRRYDQLNAVKTEQKRHLDQERARGNKPKI